MTQNQTITKIAIFQKKEIRKIFHKGDWWFSVIDVIEVLTDTARPRKYWSNLKKKLVKEGFIEVSDKIGHLKLTSPDGKKRETDCANTETIFRIIQVIPSPKAEPFKRWLAKVGQKETKLPNKNLKQVPVDKINNSHWWHVPPMDSDAYKKRGKFLASTFSQASFYGRPNNKPEKVAITNPIWGTSELEILKTLFPNECDNLYATVTSTDEKGWYKRRIDLDAKMYQKAKKLGYDAVVLLNKDGIRQLDINRKPRSIELNLCF